jgi:hypothetical protein
MGWTLRARCWGEPPTNRILPGKPTSRSNFCLLAYSQFYTLIWWSGPCGPGIEVSPPQIKFYQANPPREATFDCWPPQNYQRKYPHLVEWTLRAWGWGEPSTNKILPWKPTPRNFCLLHFPEISKHIPSFGRVDPAGPWLG